MASNNAINCLVRSQSIDDILREIEGIVITPDGDSLQLDLTLDEQVQDLWSMEETQYSEELEKTARPIKRHGTNGIHYMWCPWYNDSCVCGPDTCGCHIPTVQKRELFYYDQLKAQAEERRDRMRLQQGQRRMRRALVYLSEIQKEAYERSYGQMTMMEVMDRVLASPSHSAPHLHACIFGYACGPAVGCMWCPKIKSKRYQLCERARYLRSALRIMDEETMEKHIASQMQEKRRAAKKFDKIRYIWRHHPKQTHDPYWNVEKYVKEGQLHSVTERTQRMLHTVKIRAAKDLASVKCEVTLDEALQARFLAHPKVAVNPLKSKAVFCEQYIQHEAHDVIGAAKKSLQYVKDKKIWTDIPHLKKEFIIQEREHKKKAKSHPEYQMEMSWQDTYECLMDLLSNACMQTGDAYSAYEKVWDIISVMDAGQSYAKGKYMNLHPIGVLKFVQVVNTHGIDNASAIRLNEISQHFRTLTCGWDQSEIQSTRVALQRGAWMEHDKAFEVMKAYSEELYEHINSVRVEMKRLRLPGKHDYDKTQPKRFIAYAWELANAWRENNGVTVIRGAEETMMSMAASAVKDGVAQAVQEPATQDGLATTIHKAFQPYLTRIMETVNRLDQHTDRISDSTTTTMESVTGLTARLEDIVGGAGEGLGALFAKCGTVTDGLGQIVETVKVLISRLGSFMPDTNTGTPWLDLPLQWVNMINATDVLELVKLYILYIHCENKMIKGVLVMLALRQLGLLSKVVEIVRWLWTEIRQYFAQETADDGNSEETWYEMLAGSIDNLNVKKAAFLSGLLVCLFCGLRPKVCILHKMGKSIMALLTNMHFVGLGLLGGKRIFEYIQATFVVVLDYIKEHYFGVKPAEKKNVADIAKWAARVKYFVTEEGIRMIRTSKVALEQATRVYPEGVELYLQTQKDKNWAGQDMTRLVQTLQKDALTVQNVVFRVQNYTSFRPTMFHIQLVGEPGIGKSTLTSGMVTNLKEKLFSSYPDHNLVYSMGDTDHYDGYAGQLFVIGDDLWKYNDAKHATAIIGLITNTPVLLPMAHLEEKGTYLDSEIMISSVNNPYPGFKDVLCQDALRRRRHVLVRVKIDPEVLDLSTQKYDGKLWNRKYHGQDPKTFPHLKFDILKSIPDTMDPYIKDVLMNDELSEKARLDAVCDGQTFSDTEEIPMGLVRPLVGLTYQQFMAQCESRYRAMRNEEKSALPEMQRRIMERNWEEIDHAIDVCYAGEAPTRFLQGLFLPTEVVMAQTRQQRLVTEEIQAGTSGLGEMADRLFVEVIAPQLSRIVSEEAPSEEVINWDEVPIPQVSQDQETMDTEYVTACDEEQDEDYLEAERKRRERLLAQRGRIDPAVMPQEDAIPEAGIFGVRKHEGKWYMHVSSGYKTPDQMYNCRLSAGQKEELRDKGPHEYAAYLRHQSAVRQVHAHLGDQGQADVTRHGYVSMNGHPSFGQQALRDAEKMLVGFVRRLVQIDGEWYMTLDHLERCIYQSHRMWSKIDDDLRHDIEEFLEVYGKDKEVIVLFELDGGGYGFKTLDDLVLADATVYDQMVLFSESFTEVQKKAIVGQAKTYWQLMGNRFWERISLPGVRTWMSETFRKLRHFAMWFWDTFLVGQRWQWSLMATVMVITMAVSIGQVFTPPQDQETSKVLFKGRGVRPLIGHFTSDVTTGFEQQAESLVRRNLVRCVIGNDSFNGIKSGQYIYTVWHALRKVAQKNEPFELKYVPTCVNNEMWTCIIQPGQIVHHPNSDFGIIYSPDLPAAREIDRWFLTSEDMDQLRDADVAHCYFDKDGFAHMVQRRPLKIEPVTQVVTGTWEGTCNWMIKMDSTAVVGSSGGPVLTASPHLAGRRIIGVQSINREPWAYAQGITQEMIGSCKKLIHYTRSPIYEEGPLIAEETMASYNERYITEHLDVVGAVPKNYRAGVIGETKFVKTILSQDFESQRCPAILQKKHPAVPAGVHPLQHSVNKFGRDVMPPLPPELVERAVKDLTQYVKAQARVGELRQMSFEEIVLGHNHPGSGPMNLQTSPGLPYVLKKGKKKGKKDWIQVDEMGDIDFLSEELVEEFEAWDASIRRGVVPPCSMYEFPKDELRPKEKALGIGGPIKTRSITVLNMLHMMLFRKYHLDLTSHMHVAADGNFQSCVGINPEGPEWMSMFVSLCRMNANKCFDLDVSNWDGHFTPQTWFAVVKLINGVYGDEEHSEAATARYALAHAAIFGYDQFEDVVYKKCRGHPSGFGGTAIYNTLGHMIVFYVLWLWMAKKNGKLEYMNWMAYNANVCARFYGDDMVCAVHNTVADWFNGVEVASAYEHFGWPATTAAKDGEMQPFSDVFGVQFLKRKFVFDEEYGMNCVHGQIDECVIVDLFVWMRRNSRTVCRDQLMSNIHNAFQFAFAYGREYYQRLYNKVNAALARNGFDLYYIDYEIMRECMLRERFGLVE